MSIITKIVANPPSKLHTLAELRVFWELGGFVCTRYLMKQFAKGDGHPVILLPGFMASDTGMTPLRRLLTDLKVQAFTVSQPLRWAFGYYAVC